MSTKRRLLTATGEMAAFTPASRPPGVAPPGPFGVRVPARLSAFAVACGGACLARLAVHGSEEWRDAREFLRRRRSP